MFSLTKFKKRYNVCGRNLLQLRKSLKLSQTDLARKVQLEGLSIDKKTISLIENEKRGFQDYEIICFAKAMNIPTSYILDGPPENEEKSEDKSEN